MAKFNSEYNQAVRELAQSIEDFHDRFQVTDNDLSHRFIILREEVREHLADIEAGYLDPALEEIADVAYVALGTLHLHGEHGLTALKQVAYKNDSKTWDTHYINEETGKITRRS